MGNQENVCDKGERFDKTQSICVKNQCKADGEDVICGENEYCPVEGEECVCVQDTFDQLFFYY